MTYKLPLLARLSIYLTLNPPMSDTHVHMRSTKYSDHILEYSYDWPSENEIEHRTFDSILNTSFTQLIKAAEHRRHNIFTSFTEGRPLEVLFASDFHKASVKLTDR